MNKIILIFSIFLAVNALAKTFEITESCEKYFHNPSAITNLGAFLFSRCKVPKMTDREGKAYCRAYDLKFYKFVTNPTFSDCNFHRPNPRASRVTCVKDIELECI